MTIQRKLFSGLILIFLLFSIILAFVNYQFSKDNLFAAAKAKLIGDLELGYRYLDTKIPGDWEIRDGVLYKGNVKMNENYEIVDEIGKLTGGNTFTIFLYDTRIATNVLKPDGQRAIGTTVSEQVKKVVLEQKERYIGRAEVVGQWNQTAYDPIFDKDGNVIGIWYTGVPEDYYLKIANQSALINLLISAVLTLILFALGVWYTRRTIITPILFAVEHGQEMANGIFTRQVPEIYLKRNDEIGQLAMVLAQLTHHMTSMIQKIQESSHHATNVSTELAKGQEQITAASSQVAEAISGIAVGVSNQSKHANEILSMMENSVTLVQRGFQQADNTWIAAKQSTQSAYNGQQAILSAIQHLEEITRNVEYAATTVQQLGKRSEEIGSIITTITTIAEQTNLLALNAAIEAARAGEHGRGFAVVAEEVRKLAEDSSTSAKQITEILHNIQTETKTTVATIQSTSDAVYKQVSLIEEGKVALEEIIRQAEMTEKDADEMKQILTELKTYLDKTLNAVREITDTLDEMTAAAEEVSASAEEQAATVEEITSSFESLTEMIEQQNHLVARFQV